MWYVYYCIYCQWGVLLFDIQGFDHDKHLLAYCIKKNLFQFLFDLRNDLKIYTFLVANTELRIGGAHPQSVESCAQKQFFQPNIESSINVSQNWFELGLQLALWQGGILVTEGKAHWE